MVAKMKPPGLEDLLRRSLTAPSEAPRPNPPAPTEALVQRRGADAILDTEDCQILLYEMYEDRA